MQRSTTADSSARILIPVLIFALGVAVILLWVTQRPKTVEAPNLARLAATPDGKTTPLHEGWKSLDIKNKVTINLPQDMKQVEPIGDADWYREAYANRDVSITIVFGYFEALRPHEPDPFDLCETPRTLLDKPAYHESGIEIDGRKAKLGIDRYRQAEFISAVVCFPQTADSPEPFRVVAYCRDERALETTRQIFASIKFRRSS